MWYLIGEALGVIITIASFIGVSMWLIGKGLKAIGEGICAIKKIFK